MGSNVDTGSQNLTLDFEALLTAEKFTQQLDGVLKAGIYNGFTPTIVNASDVEITTGVVLIKDSGNHTVRIRTTQNVTLQPTQSDPYMVIRWDLQSQTDWYAEITEDNSFQANDVVIAKAEHNNNGDVNGLDFSDRTYPDIDYTKVFSGDVRYNTGWTVNRTDITSGNSYNVNETDYLIAVDVSNTININLPDSDDNRNYIIKDKGGNAGSNTITVQSSVTGHTVDGSNSQTITNDYGRIEVVFDAGNNNWMVVD